MNLKIYTIHHFIPEWYLDNEVFVPFIVDAYKYPKSIFLPFETDDNLPLAFKHHSFAEMRCHYWAYIQYHVGWRLEGKAPAPDYVGFFHYRRKLMTWQPKPSARSLQIPSKEEFKNNTAADIETSIFKDICNKYDIILPCSWRILPDLAENYCRAHGPETWLALIDALMHDDLLPVGFYISGENLYPCNIFIMRSDIFAEYMAWWEKIMIQLMKVISPPPPPEYQSRVFGFISDRMFTIWLKHQREQHPEWRILELPMLIGDFSSI